ncbi:MAG: FAD:protein FMN transferase [Candidatus Promineifilaceae bacterium]
MANMKSMTMTEPAAWQWCRRSFRAMNTDVHLSLAAREPQAQLRLVEESFRYFEQLLSRFRPDSELSRFNASGADAFQASTDFFAAVQAALWAAQQTAGIYDPTILDYLEEAGYDRTFSAITDPRPLTKDNGMDAGAAAPSSTLVCGETYGLFCLDPFSQLIWRPPGLRIDLGGMGKGWTVDRVADALCQEGHFLLNAGGDLYAYGTNGLEKGWDVHLALPFDDALTYATLVVDHHAVATSTTARRRWMKDGFVQHHLIDPRTGRPAQTDAVSVSVVAGRAFTAEIYAKTALILGIQEGLAFLDSLPEVEGILFSEAREVYLTNTADRFLMRLDPAGYRPPSTIYATAG